MTDVAPADTATETTSTPNDTADTDAIDWQAEAEKFKAMARKHEDRAKANAAAAKELEQVKAASMSDIEKAVAQAKAEGRSEGLAAAATKVVAAEFKAAAAGRLDTDALAILLDGLNLVAFMDEEGNVDTVKVQSFVDGIAPAPASVEDDLHAQFKTLDLGQGSRNPNPNAALNSDELLRAVMDKVGPRKQR
jgi:hypothetical protein